MAILEKREKAINKKEDRVNAIESDLEGEIRKRVNSEVYEIEGRLESEYKKKEWKLKDKYKTMTDYHQIGYYSSLGMTLLFIIGTLATSKPYQGELIDFFKNLVYALIEILSFPCEAGFTISEKMFDEVSSPVGYWAIGIVIAVIMYVGMIVLLVVSSKFLIDNIEKHLCDGITVAVLVVITGFTMFLAPILVEAEMPINLITFRILIFIGYMIIRFLYEWDIHSIKKKALMWILILTGAWLFVKLLWWLF